MSHDRYFINKTATRILELTGETFINYIGNYDYYVEKRDLMNSLYGGGKADVRADGRTGMDSVKDPAGSQSAGLSDNAGISDGKRDWKNRKEEQARIRKRQNELKKTEDEIASLEQRDQEIDEQLMQPEVASDVGKLMEFHKEKEGIAERLSVLYELWETLAEENDG